MASRVESGDFFSRLEIATGITLERSRAISREFGTAFVSGENPLLWTPYHSLEQNRFPRILRTIFNSALHDPQVNKSGDLKIDDLPAMMMAANFFYPKFGDFYPVNDSLAKSEMVKAKIFRPRDFEMIPLLMDSAVLKQSADPKEKFTLKPILPDSSFALQRKIFVDTMNSFGALPETMAMVPLLGVERLYDSVRKYERGEKGGNKDAIRMKNGDLPRSLNDVLAPGTRYDSDIIKAQIETHHEFYFTQGKVYEPQLQSSRQHLSHFSENQQFFNDHIYLNGQAVTDLRALFHITSEFYEDQREKHMARGGGLLD